MFDNSSDERSDSALFDARYHRLAVVAFSLLLGSTWWVFRDSPSAEENEGPAPVVERADVDALSGRVTDPAGRPIPDARVTAGDRSVTTDDDGAFAFPDLSPGTYLVDADAEGFVRPGVGDEARAVAIVERNEPVDEFELTLQKPSSISGRITAGGDPVDDADVGVSYQHAEGLSGEPLPPYVDAEVASSEEGGEFTLPEIAPGRLTMVVESDKGYAETDEILLPEDQQLEDVVVDVAPSGRIEATVTDQHGEPVEADVTLSAWFADQPARQLTATDGSFSLDELQQGRYILEVDADDYRSETLDDLVVHADETAGLDVELEPLRGLGGMVVEPDGTPVPGAHVSITRGQQHHSMRTDENGRFEWPDITDGQWEAVADPARHDPSPPTPIRPGEEIALEVERGGEISGRVVDESNLPVDNYSITVEFLEIRGQDHHHIGRLPPEDFANARGHFTVGPIPTGRYQLVVDAPDHPQTRTDPLELEAGDSKGPLTIELPGGTEIRGRVTDRETDQPLAGARIFHQVGASANAVATSDAEGHYRLQNIPPGHQKIRVEHDGYVTELFDGVRVPDGEGLTYDVGLEPVGDGPRGYARYGIGAAFRPVDEGVEIIDVESDSPAASELEQGDRILSVDGVSAEEMTFGEIVQRIRGDGSTSVTLEVERDGFGVRSYEVARERVFTPEES